MQLVAYGAQDIYLTGNPQITFFKVMYRRHTHFSLESIAQTFNGQVDFGKKITCTISRNGDLVHRMYLRVTLPKITSNAASGTATAAIPGNATTAAQAATIPMAPDGTEPSEARWVDHVGHALINNVDVEIGGQRIDRHYGEWLHVWNELTQTTGHDAGYNAMIGHHPDLIQPTDKPMAVPFLKSAPGEPEVYETTTKSTLPEYTMYIPLIFWFNRNPGLALPLIALQYHEIKINFEFREQKALVIATNENYTVAGKLGADLYVDYIYMDTDERRRRLKILCRERDL